MTYFKDIEARRGNRWVRWAGRGVTRKQAVAWAEEFVRTSSVPGHPLYLIDNRTGEIFWREDDGRRRDVQHR